MADLKRAERSLKKAKESGDTKRVTFLEATIAIYKKALKEDRS